LERKKKGARRQLKGGKIAYSRFRLSVGLDDQKAWGKEGHKAGGYGGAHHLASTPRQSQVVNGGEEKKHRRNHDFEQDTLINWYLLERKIGRFDFINWGRKTSLSKGLGLVAALYSH